MSTLFHTLGLLLSDETKRDPWFYMIYWDLWLAWLSPMTFTDVPWAVIGIFNVILFDMTIPFNSSVARLPPIFLYLHILFLESLRTRLFTTSLIILPQTASKLTDLDQFVSLMTGVAIMAYQWELWNPPQFIRKVRMKSLQNLRLRNLVELKISKKICPRPLTKEQAEAEEEARKEWEALSARLDELL
ncbi:hypothetical protein CPB86DRAFT_818216 [Serendipita vermifera]|nr:hypothetical protein CPB86DRAFT_818216 [Serendipita vermifera]